MKHLNFKTFNLSDFCGLGGSPLNIATNEAYIFLINHKPLYNAVRILADSGKCIKVVHI